MTTKRVFVEKPNTKCSYGWFKEMVVALAAVLALNVYARESDGMYFDLKCLGDANDNGRLDLNEVVNTMAVGAADGGVSIYGNPVNNPVSHELIGFTEETAWRKFYIRASPVRNALRIPQSYYLSDDGQSIYAIRMLSSLPIPARWRRAQMGEPCSYVSIGKASHILRFQPVSSRLSCLIPGATTMQRAMP